MSNNQLILLSIGGATCSTDGRSGRSNCVGSGVASSRHLDSLRELFPNRTKADKTLISVMAEMAFRSPWKQMRVSKP